LGTVARAIRASGLAEEHRNQILFTKCSPVFVFCLVDSLLQQTKATQENRGNTAANQDSDKTVQHNNQQTESKQNRVAQGQPALGRTRQQIQHTPH
jgi:hypothetical protein